ncbi:MAG: hypothetical protein ACRDPR_11630 [Nocardioidaceae bacterium]
MDASVDRRLSGESGFSMFLVIMTLFVTTTFVGAGFAAANGDLPLSGDSRDRKTAYAAAEAGVNFYQYHLNQDNDYWLKCTNVNPPNLTEESPVNQKWDGVSRRVWRKLPGSDSRYTIELLPAPGFTKCEENKQETMLDPSSGTFRIRVTGQASEGSPVKRSIVATFRRRSFLDFLYFTEYETTDPKNYTSANFTQATNECAKKYRALPPATPGSGGTRTSWCSEIQFVTGDKLNGPLHTDDSMLMCGTPLFGRNAGDKVETGQPAPGWVANPSAACGTTNPTFMSPLQTSADPLEMPATNTSLKAVADANYVFRGATTIVLDATAADSSAMTVTNADKGFVNQTMALPANGVVYVENSGTCNPTPPRDATYPAPPIPGCGDLTVTGSAKKSLTLAAQNDVIVKPIVGQPDTGLRKAGDAVLGLIAGNFVRVYHKTVSGVNADPPQNVTIDAAILSLQHSFTVDNFDKGDPLGTLTVNGAIAQLYRGAVGRGSGATITNGFLKNYWYDDRLKYRTPPFFLEPVSASWHVLKQNEQVPAT